MYRETTQIREAAKQLTYAELLNFQQWKDMRELVLSRDLRQCRVCNSPHNLEVHHRQYHKEKHSQLKYLPWEYDLQLLITLCRNCHQKGHEKFIVKSINI